MENSAVNNTTQLNMGEPKDFGVVGQRQFVDSTARQISAEISRNEYRKAIVSDDRMQQFRDAVFKMVSSWATEDKIAIITEYGDHAFLNKYKNPSEDVINKICTESIIVHLDPADLKQLYNDIGIKEKRMTKDIRSLNEKKYPRVPRATMSNLNTAGFQEIYEKHAKIAYTADDYKRNRKDADPSYSVPPEIIKNYGTLRRELDDVLKNCFGKIELQNLAFKMDIEIPEGTPWVRIRRWIINKVCLYVDLVVGRGKATYAGAIFDPEPYNNILKYTSYSYITGKPGLSPKEFNDLKKQARIAQVAIKERAKMQSYNKHNFKSKAMEELAGVRGGMSKVARNLRNNDTGILKDATYDQLAVLAGKYGIDPTSKENKNVGMLKAKIYNAMLNESKRVNYLEKQKRKLETKGKTTRNIDDLLAVHRGFSDASVLKKPDAPLPAKEDIPIVHFRNNGSLRERRVLSAVPVYLVGQGGAGSQKDNRTDSEKEEETKQSLKDAHNSLSKLVGAKYKKKFFSKSKSLKMVTDRDDLGEKDKEIYDMFIRLPLLSKRTGVHNANENTFNSMYDFIFNFDKRYHLVVDGQPMSLMAMLASKVLGLSIIISSSKIVVDDKHTDVLNRLKALNNSDKEADVKEVFRIKHFLMYIYGLQIKSSDLCNFIYNIDENIRNYAKKIVIKKNINPMWKDNAKTARKAGALMGGKTTNQTKFGKLIKGLEIAKNLKAHFSGQRPLKPEELKDRSFYDSIMNILTQYGNGETPESYDKAYAALRDHLLPVDGSIHTGLSRDKFEALERNIPEGKRASITYARKRFYILAAILSKLNSKIPTYNLFMYLAGIVDDKGKATAGNDDLLDMINACFNLKGKARSAFKKITSALKGAFTREKNPAQSNSKVDYSSQDFAGNKVLREQKISEDLNSDVYDPEKNPGQRMPIPNLKIPIVEWKGDPIPPSETPEVIPVYVVNQLTNELLDAIDILNEIRDAKGGKEYTEGIGGNVSKVEKYQRERMKKGDRDISEADISKGKNDITLTRAAQEIKSEMITKAQTENIDIDPETGYTKWKPKSAVFNNPNILSAFDENIGKKYKIKNEDLDFAIKYGIKFANGGSVPAGVPAIVGDNPKGNGKENLEIIKGRPDGGVDVVPIAEKLDRSLKERRDRINELIANKTGVDRSKASLADAIAEMRSDLNERIKARLEEKKISPTDEKKAAEAEAKAEIKKTEVKEKKTKKKKSKKKELVKLTELSGYIVDPKGYVNANAKAAGVKNIFAMPAIPVMAVNRSLNGTALLDTMTSFMKSVNSHMTDLKLGLASEVIAAPMGVGAITRPMMISGGIIDKVANIAGQVMDTAMDAMIDSMQAYTGGTISRAYTGGKLTRFATGGSKSKLGGKGKLPAAKLSQSQMLKAPKAIEKKSEEFLSVITGDAASSNIFANGAKPELVQSQSDIKVTPLNKTGEENKQKISRMTPSERAQALATAISSHVIKYKYTLPNGAEDLSNLGEAIKVFNVKPGITDEINVDGTTTSVAQLLMNIYNQLQSIGALETTNTGLLTTIANSSAVPSRKF